MPLVIGWGLPLGTGPSLARSGLPWFPRTQRTLQAPDADMAGDSWRFGSYMVHSEGH